jgi:hypothetical protein
MDSDYLTIPTPPTGAPKQTVESQVEAAERISGSVPPSPQAPKNKSSLVPIVAIGAIIVVAIILVAFLLLFPSAPKENQVFNILNSTQVAAEASINTTCTYCLTKNQFASLFNAPASMTQSAELVPITILTNPEDLNGLGGYKGPPSTTLIKSLKELWFYGYAAPTNGGPYLAASQNATIGGSETIVETSNASGVYSYIINSQPSSTQISSGNVNGFTYSYFNNSYIGLDNKTHQNLNMVGYSNGIVAYVKLGGTNTISLASPSQIASILSASLGK